MEATKKVSQIIINHILLHVNPHWDEIVAVWILKIFGEGRYKGIGEAKVRYTKGVEPKGDALFDLIKMLPVGCGQGRYDEHRTGLKDANGKSIDRLPDECATTLVCKDLELMQVPTIKRIAEATLYCDTHAGVKVTEMPTIVKAMHRRLPEGSETVREWAAKAVRAIHGELDLNLSSMPGEKTLKEIFTELDRDGRFPEKRSRDGLASDIGKCHSEVERTERESFQIPFLELAFVVKALQRTDIVPSSEIIDWTMFALDHLYTDQTEFWAVVDDAKTRRIGRVEEILKGVYGGKDRRGVKILLIHSDSQLVAKASRMKEVGADVVIVRDSTGRIYVSVDADTDLNLGNFVRMLRWLEYPKNGQGEPIDEKGNVVEVTWDELGVEGEHPRMSHIYYFKNQIINGGPTHPDKPPVAVCSQALLQIGRCAFDKYVFDWMRECGAPMPKKGLNGIGDAMPPKAANSTLPPQDENPPAGEDKKAA